MRLASYAESDRVKRIARLLVKKGHVIGLLLFLAGIAFSFLLVDSDYNKGMYFDENALLTGLVKREYGHSASDISSIVTKLDISDGTEESTISLVAELLEQIKGMELYLQNFSAAIPVTTEKGMLEGRNVYGVLRAGRSASVEALVLTAPASLANGQKNYAIAVLLTLAKFFSTKNYWGKDLIFLVTSKNEVGMQAWLNAYLGEKNEAIQHGPLLGRSGAIQAAINLEAAAKKIQHINIIAGGINGILPNLDMVSVAQRLCELEAMSTIYHVPWSSDRFLSEYQHSLLTTAATVAHQAAGLPSTNHATFLRYRIDSLTLQTIPGSLNDLTALARALEGIFRSLNNLLERLHHSVFFYLTPSQNSFIAVSQYIPAISMLLAPLILEGVVEWMLVHNKEQILITESTTDRDNKGIPLASSFPFWLSINLLVVCICAGVLLAVSPVIAIAVLGGPLPPNVLFYTLASVCTVTALAPMITRVTVPERSWRLCKALLLLLVITTLFGLSLVNFSLAFLLSLFLSLPFFITKPSSSKCMSVSQILLLFTSPPLIVFWCCLGYVGLFVVPGHSGLAMLVQKSGSLFINGLAFSYNSSLLCSSWLYSVLCLVVWPQWLAFWCLSCCTLKNDDSVEAHPHSD